MTKPNHYSVLGIDQTSTADQVQQAYHRKANELHPDRHSTAADDVQRAATRAMSDVNEAFRVLGDPIRRKAYDVSLARSQARQRARRNRSVDLGSAPAVALYLLILAVGVPVLRAITDSGEGVKLIWAGAFLATLVAVGSIWFVIRDMGR